MRLGLDYFFFQAEDGIRDGHVTGVQTCALPIYYHFAAHMWVPFVLPGLALGYFIYKRKMPARLSSTFSPLLGGKVYEWPGKLIDALSIIGTVFGLAVSVGLGVLQINAGMNIMWDVPLISGVELAIIIVVTIAASVDRKSVV